MSEPQWTKLADRSVVTITGPDAERFLQDLVTCDVASLGEGAATLGALLSPQGKVLFDFIIFRVGPAYLLDLPAATKRDFLARLGLYRLRTQVELSERSGVSVLSLRNGAKLTEHALAEADDPRLPALGRRAIVSGDPVVDGVETPAHAYDALRIGLGIPEGGKDFAFGDIFAHEGDYDQLGAVGFKKGCFVGQEIVSRMEHRGTARRRIIMVAGESLGPGEAVMAGGKELGRVCTTAGRTGLALVRLDRAAAAQRSGEDISVAGGKVTLSIPDWARFDWPRDDELQVS